MRHVEKAVLVTAVLGLLAGGALLMKSGSAPETQTNESFSVAAGTELPDRDTGRSPAAAHKGPALDLGQKGAKEIAPEAPKGTATLSSGPAGLTSSGELATYAHLKKKVFLSAEEKSEKERLFRDTGFFRSLEELLRLPATVGSELQAQQFAALDAVFEALEVRGASDAAQEVLKAVVQDPRIEDPKLDRDTREALAGVKAEVLYQWSAQDPSRAEDMRRMLPGPVSEKIWSNVREAQRQNESESELEARTASKDY